MFNGQPLIDTYYHHTYNNIEELNCSLPIFQRKHIESHTNEIVEYCKTFISKGLVPPLEPISIGYYDNINNFTINTSRVFHIIDGQHRYNCYKILYNLGAILKVHVNFYRCINQDEAYKLYTIRNTKQMIHTIDEISNMNNDLDDKIKEYLSNDNDRWSLTKCNRPKINIIMFLDMFKNSKYYHLIKTIDEFIKFITMKNIEEYNKLSSNQSLIKSYSITNNMISIAKSKNFFLGLDSGLSWLNN
jgi:hypothetical protein